MEIKAWMSCSWSFLGHQIRDSSYIFKMIEGCFGDCFDMAGESIRMPRFWTGWETTQSDLRHKTTMGNFSSINLVKQYFIC